MIAVLLNVSGVIFKMENYIVALNNQGIMWKCASYGLIPRDIIKKYDRIRNSNLP